MFYPGAGDRLQSGQNRQLASRPAMYHRKVQHMAHPLAGRREELFILGVNHDDDRSRSVPCRKNVKRMSDNRAIADRAILLRPLARLTGALAAAGRDDNDTAGELFFGLHLLYGVPLRQ